MVETPAFLFGRDVRLPFLETVQCGLFAPLPQRFDVALIAHVEYERAHTVHSPGVCRTPALGTRAPAVYGFGSRSILASYSYTPS